MQTDKGVHRFPLGDVALAQQKPAQQWQAQIIDISALKGQQLQRLSLELSDARPAKLQLRLGQIALTDTAKQGVKP